MKTYIPILTFLFTISAVAGFHLVTTRADDAGGTAFFNDVERNAYYDEPVVDMVRKGIVKGYDDGRFAPNDQVTRGQVVTMLHRYDQNVVQSLRDQIAKLRQLLDLGKCGDGHVQVGEQCDDENVLGGDGCSSECLKEKVPSLSRGCVVGGCSGQLCHNEGEDIMSTCEWKEEYRCYKSAICERQSDASCGWTKTNDFLKCMDHASYPDDFCKEKEQQLADTLRSHRACRTDDDCSVLVRGCSPFQTCGKPVNKGSIGIVKESIATYAKACPEDPSFCSACEIRSSICYQGFCRLDPPTIPECGNKICERQENNPADMHYYCPEDCE